MHIVFFYIAALSNPVDEYQSCEETYSLRLQGRDSIKLKNETPWP
jgi:hypothetical protein